MENNSSFIVLKEYVLENLLLERQDFLPRCRCSMESGRHLHVYRIRTVVGLRQDVLRMHWTSRDSGFSAKTTGFTESSVSSHYKLCT